MESVDAVMNVAIVHESIWSSHYLEEHLARAHAEREFSKNIYITGEIVE